MKFSAPIVLTALVVPVAFSNAYSLGGGYGCGPRGNSVFGARQMMQQQQQQLMTPQQQAEFRRQQSEFADRAFEALARDLQQKTTQVVDPNFIPKQKELVDKAVEFFTDMGSIGREDANSLRDLTNKGFEIAQDFASGAYSPASDMQDKDTEVEISLDLPGVSKADIDIVFEDGFLKVTGTRKMGRKVVDEDNEPKEQSVPFSRSFPVDPKTTDIEDISATLDSGVLLVRIPKKKIEMPPGKRIDIQ